jgi:hypothetical protein
LERCLGFSQLGEPLEDIKLEMRIKHPDSVTYSWQPKVVFVCNCLWPSFIFLIGFQIPPGLATFLIDQSPASIVGLEVAITVGLQMALSRAPPRTNV